MNRNRHCQHILETGKNKGKQCDKRTYNGRKYCDAHITKNELRELAEQTQQHAIAEAECLAKYGMGLEAKEQADREAIFVAEHGMSSKEWYVKRDKEHQEKQKEYEKQKEQERQEKINTVIASRVADPDYDLKYINDILNQSGALEQISEFLSYDEPEVALRINMKEQAIYTPDGRKIMIKAYYA